MYVKLDTRKIDQYPEFKRLLLDFGRARDELQKFLRQYFDPMRFILEPGEKESGK